MSLPGPKLHVINLDSDDLDKVWLEIVQESIIYGTAFAKINWTNPEKVKEFWGKSPLEDIKDKK